MLDTVKINHVQHISFTQSRLTDAVSVILSELLSYEHPSNGRGFVRINHRMDYRILRSCAVSTAVSFSRSKAGSGSRITSIQPPTA